MVENFSDKLVIVHLNEKFLYLLLNELKELRKGEINAYLIIFPICIGIKGLYLLFFKHLKWNKLIFTYAG